MSGLVKEIEHEYVSRYSNLTSSTFYFCTKCGFEVEIHDQLLASVEKPDQILYDMLSRSSCQNSQLN